MAPGTEELVKETSESDSDDTAHARSASPDTIRDRVIEQLKTVFDPEIPVNIYELGLIYKVDVAEDGATKIAMTLTTPMCPAAEELPPEVETKARTVPGVTSVQLDLVWDPPWSPDRMSDAAKLDLGMT
jgi:FeS assembly SUF system protein